MKYVYHSSNIKGLEKILPMKSTHGCEYVYATEYRIISALFLARWNDFLITLLTDFSNDKLNIKLIERYPNAFEDIFKGKSGYIYSLDSSNFTKSTSWECEVVSTNLELVYDKEYINDVYELIKEFEERNSIEMYYYPNRPSDIPLDDSDMISKALELYNMSGNPYNIDYCIERFPKFKDQLLKEKLLINENI